MIFALLRDMAPTTTSYIAGFAQAGYYQNCDFFRVTNLVSSGTPGFIAQAGDPTNTGTGGPGFSFDDENHPSLIFSGAGQLAMANAGIDTSTFRGTNGSQFYITDYTQALSTPVGTLRYLDFGHPIFGQLLTGFDTMQKVMAVKSGTDGQTPIVPVVMDSVTVSEDNRDAILLVSANGPATGATITITGSNQAGDKIYTVSSSGTTPTPAESITVSAVKDTTDDPPFLVPDDNAYGAPRKKVTLPVVTRDLEYDFLSTGGTILSGTNFATIKLSEKVATLTPNPFSPIGGVTVGLDVYEPLSSTSTVHYSAVNVGLGTNKLTPAPALLYATSGTTLDSGTGGMPSLGSFLCSNPKAVASDFSATVNWGDGSTISSGSNVVSVARSGYLPTTYFVSTSSSANHVYAHPGIYPLNVTVSDTYGDLLQLKNTAVVSSSNIYAFGRTFMAASGSFDGLVATFLDFKGAAQGASALRASINWGDGVVDDGTILGSKGSFQVYGHHRYSKGSTYPVDVTITSLADPTQSGYAWSIAKLTGVPTQQPPFPQPHIIGELTNAGYGPGFLDEQVILFNSGVLPSGPVTLTFYASPTNATNPIDSSAVLLQVGKNFTYTSASIPPGGEISGVVSEIFLPSNIQSSGKYLIMSVSTADPLSSHMPYAHAFADPNPLLY